MMDERERQPIILRTYKSVWKVPKKIYSIDTIKLLIPIDINEALYFAISVGLTVFLIKFIPLMNKIPFAIRFFAIPYGLMKFFTKQKLDGKLPHKFFLDYMVYKLSPKKYSLFRPIENHGKVKFVTPIFMRDVEIVNKTEEALKKIKKEKPSRQKGKNKKVKFKPGSRMRKEA